jgi:hypothetical protein
MSPSTQTAGYSSFLGESTTPSAEAPPSNSFLRPPSPGKRPVSSAGVPSSTNRDHITASTAQQKLESLGLRTVVAPYKCPADVNTVGTWDVGAGQAGNYALVFDNTFSKQVSKSATFVLLIYRTDAPPTSGLQQGGPAGGSAMSLAVAATQTRQDGVLGTFGSVASTESLGTSPPQHRSVFASGGADGRRPRSRRAADKAQSAIETSMGTVYAGIMHKKRRKHNTFAKRFFSLDTATGTLSYYKNRQSSALRGAIPLTLAVVSVNDRTREISVDSGAEIWHLRVGAQRDFDGWKDALDRVSTAAAAAAQAVAPNVLMDKGKGAAPAAGEAAASAILKKFAVADEQEWQQVEALVGRVAGIRDAVRRLAKDTDPKYLLLPPPIGGGNGTRSTGVSPSRTPSEASFDMRVEDDTATGEEKAKRPFWKRKASNNSATGSSSQAPSQSGFFKRSASAQQVPTASSGSLNGGQRVSRLPGLHHLMDDGVHGNCVQVMHDLDQVVAQFSELLGNSKKRRRPQSMIFTSPGLGMKRHSTRGSMSSDEFFDAHEGDTPINRSQLLEIRRDSHDLSQDEPVSIVDDGDSSSEDEFADPLSPPDGSTTTFHRRLTVDDETSLFPRKPKNLTPLPINTTVSRRITVPPPKAAPPSLIAFLRKNVGKDLSTIAMPVSANEPLSALQRIAEQLEYSALLDKAASESDSTIRLLLVSAFAISSFSSNRAKERAVRKPFNPMLGETFELVREDLGFRLIAEKVCHRPVRMAIQAESVAGGGWTFFQCATPTQKFWGKSAELNTEGKARVVLHQQGEVFAWTVATSFLRNVIAGEKYVEPVSTMTVLNETSGAKAVVAFKSGGMFAGRSEEVNVTGYDPTGNLLPVGLAGRWTSSLKLINNGGDDLRGDPARRAIEGTEAIWTVGELVPNPAATYGFTRFAAQLNEVTELEKGKMPVTDSRLRPDQKLLEDGRIDDAEALKGQLEESQRGRRKAMEDIGNEWKPKWFVTSGVDEGEAVWKLKGGKEGYWETREKGEWKDVVKVFE